jgi:Acetyltransferase (GNAT) domain
VAQLRAELVADGGERALSDDFFRSREFHAAERVTHTLVVEDRLAVALVVSEIPGADGLRDAVSAYGYPGALVNGEPLDPAEVDWSGSGLVSAFLRDAVGRPPSLLGATLRSEVHVVDPHEPLELRSTHARHVRRNARYGYATRYEEGAEALADFQRVYRQTMERTQAGERYLFPDAYFAQLLASEHARLLITRTGEGLAASGAILVESDGYLHYFLGGSADELLEHSPFKTTMAAMIELARERELPLNLGGGVRPGDALDHFKRGFANRIEPFHTHELVCDVAAYERLSEGRTDAAGFFPLYRS